MHIVLNILRNYVLPFNTWPEFYMLEINRGKANAQGFQNDIAFICNANTQVNLTYD